MLFLLDLMRNLLAMYFIFIEIVVRFDNKSYFVDEVAGIVQPLLVLNDTSLIAITIQLISNDIDASGMVNYVCMYLRTCICIHT